MCHARRQTLALAVFGLAIGAAADMASANPLGPQIVGGSAQVSGVGTSSVTVNQGSERAIINWRSFDIGAGEHVRFNQPDTSSVMLNRVIGGLGPSMIAGTLTANGRVFLVNPDGMLFGAGAIVNTSGFLATTHDIRNEDFMAGNFKFDIPGRPDASIVNLGTITASNAGFAALVAPGVRNAGTITARLGKVALASANSFTLDFYGDQLITLSVGDEIATDVKDVATGQPLGTLVKNDGRLSANGGQVQLSAATARKVVDSVINNTGVIEARSVGTRNGRIVLGAQTASTKTAGAPKQTVKLSGKLDVSGRKAGERGGTVRVTGERIEVKGADIDASGEAGGGKVLIGGDTGGGKGHWAADQIAKAALEPDFVQTATEVTVDAWSRIDASATGSGDGGKVIVWADDSTAFAGTILAKGGTIAGDGGFVEVSGKERLAFGGSVDTRAPAGATGTLLLDPRDFYITGIGGPNPPPDASNMTAEDVEDLLALTNVVIVTDGSASPTGQHGDIFVDASLSWGTANSLTLMAHRNIEFGANVTVTSAGAGDLVLRADSEGTGTGTVVFSSGAGIDFSNSTGTVSIFYNPTDYANPTDFSAWVASNGNVPDQLTSFMLVNSAQDLQDISTNLSGHYALGRDIDAGVTATWNGGDGFIPIGTSANPFDGMLIGAGGTVAAGLGSKIENLYIDGSGLDYVGLFGVIGDQGSVGGVNLVNVDITTAGDFAGLGALAGRNEGQVWLSSASGSVRNISPVLGQTSAVGGLVGINDVDASIVASSSAVDIEIVGPTMGWVDGGGLVGKSSGSIYASYASGSLVASALSIERTYIGGLVGWMTDGEIVASYALTSLTSGSGNATAGGLVGVASSGTTINQTYAAGAMNITGAPIAVGGLIGSNSGAVTDSYWDTETTGVDDDGNGAGSGLTTAELKGGPVGFSWPIWGSGSPGINAGYPYLFWQGPITPPFGPPPETPPTDHEAPSEHSLPSADAGNQQVTQLTQQSGDQPTSDPLPGTPPEQASNGGGGQGGGGSGGGSGNGGQQPPLRKVPGPDGERFSSVPPPGETRFLPTEVILQIPDRITPEQVEAVVNKLGLTLVTTESLPSLGRRVYRFSLPEGWTVRDMILALEASSVVAIAQPNYVYQLARAATAPASAPTTQPEGAAQGDPAQYVMGKLHLAEAHRIADGRDVVIAVIDSQVDREHSELLGVISEHFSTAGDETDAPHAHGTAMAGAIAARDRLLGVAPRARILAVRAFSEQQSTAESTSFSIVRSIDWAVAQGASVINMSFAGPRDPSLQRMLQAAYRKGVVLVAAAGNAGPKAPPLYPGADPNVIAVTATDAEDRVFHLAGRGRHISIAAPGVDILAPAPEAGYQMSTGTSIATAHISGVVALMLERDPSLTPAQVREILQNTAQDLGSKGRDNESGWGLVDPQRALQAVTLRDAARSRLRTQ